MNSSYLLLLIGMSYITFLFPQNKLNFSANIAESVQENGETVKVFKDNVKIIDQTRILYTDLAKKYDDLNQVKLYGNVKMFDSIDSLTCNELTLFQNDEQYYYATGDVKFIQKDRTISAENLFYYTQNKKIILTNNIVIQDSLRLITGDSLFIEYVNDKLDKMTIQSNVIVLNNQYVKLKGNLGEKFFQDKMKSNNIIIQFNDNEQISSLKLSGESSSDFSVIQDSLLKGINNISGDTILINLIENFIDRMTINGGAIGLFKPDKSNKDVNNNITYKAENINYDLDTEIAYLMNEAEVIYGDTYLTGGEIETSLNDNIVISKTKEGILPSVSTGKEEPTFGDYMTFDLTTEMGNIVNGYNEIEIGIFKGENFYTAPNNDVYIDNCIFTSCDLDEPHYYFGSKKMKIIDSKEQIIAKPMILYIQDFPAMSLPFTILPNSSGKQKSGFIMPSFGHSHETGTWIEDFGYYFAPNNYYDVLTYLDFYDKKRVKINSRLRYKKLYGDNWYNYQIEGALQINNFVKELIDPQNDFTNLSGETTENYSISFSHKQDFDITQYVRIDYEFFNLNYLSNIIENDITVRLDQREESRFYYSKNWALGSLTVGMSSDRELSIPEPEYNNELFHYKTINYPNITYLYNKPLLFGKGDKWYHTASLNYSTYFIDEKISYSKQANNDSNSNLVWSNNDILSIVNANALHTIGISIPVNIFSFSLTPKINYSENWIFNNRFSDLKARKAVGNIGLNLQTIIFGIIPLKLGNVKAIRHVMTPSMYTSYNSKATILQGSYDDFNSTNSNTSSLISSFTLNNLFQVKINDENNQDIKRNFLGLNFFTTYDWHTKNFGLLNSSISLKNSLGSEYLRINMQHRVRNFFKGRSPILKSLSTSITRTFNFKLFGESFDKDLSNNDTNIYNEDNIFNQLDNDLYDISSTTPSSWDASFGISLTARYDLETKWDIEYSKLSIFSNVNLSKEWSMNNKIYLNLDNMQVNSYEVQFKRSLHCWDFMFVMKPIGYNKGFGLKINISDPSLQSLRVTQSTMKGRSW